MILSPFIARTLVISYIVIKESCQILFRPLFVPKYSPYSSFLRSEIWKIFENGLSCPFGSLLSLLSHVPFIVSRTMISLSCQILLCPVFVPRYSSYLRYDTEKTLPSPVRLEACDGICFRIKCHFRNTE